MKKLLIIDGHGLLFQSFFGMPKRIKNSKGENIEAVICFLGILRKTIDFLKPTHLLVVFDGENTLQRKQIENSYKSNRQSFSGCNQDESPFFQLPKIKASLNFLNICNIETKDCEADDFIAGVCCGDCYFDKIYISSNDKDFFSLIDEKINVFCYRGKVSKIFDKQTFFETYDFESELFLTYRCFVGDKSDCISGIDGIGNITAKKLVQKYGNLENILNNIERIENEKIRNKINENSLKLQKNYLLMNLKENKIELKAENLEIKEIPMTNIILKKLDLF